MRDPDRPGIGVRQVSTSSGSEPLSYPVIDITHPSSVTSDHAPTPSVYSDGSVGMLATRLTSQSGGDLEKGRLQGANDERLGDIVTISKENMRPYGAQSPSDGESSFSGDEVDEKTESYPDRHQF